MRIPSNPNVSPDRALDSALNMVTSSVNKAMGMHIMDPLHHEYGGEQQVYHVTLSGGDAAYRLFNLGYGMAFPAMADLVQRADQLQADIRSITPKGEVRYLPPTLQDAIPHRSITAPQGTQSARLWEKEAPTLLRSLRKVAPESDKANIAKAHELLRSKNKWYMPPPRAPRGEEFGSLWLSIQVDSDMVEGGAMIEAYSTNYYAGFVEEGFTHALVPVMRATFPDSKRLQKVANVYAYLPRRRLGDYDLFDKEDQWSVGDNERVVNLGFSFDPNANELLNSFNQGWVAFKEREAPKSEPGVHMFRDGGAKWLLESAPAWVKAVNRIARKTFDEGDAFYAGAMRGRAGSGRGGQFAPSRKPRA